MKYYWLTHSIDIEEIGAFPQCEMARKIRGIQNQNFGFGFHERIQKEFVLPEPELVKKAIPTNFLNVVPINQSVFLVIDDDILNWFQVEIEQDFQFWNLITHYKSGILNRYNLFHLSYPAQDKVIDFQNSTFKIMDISKRKFVKEDVFDNYEEYHKAWLNYIWNGFSVESNQLVLDFSKLQDDIIRLINIPFIGIGYYVSERLKNAIEEQRFTGMAFKEINEMDKRIEVIY